MSGDLLINQAIVGHVLDILRGLPDECVQTCVTSPPYWGLRDYGTDPQIWGGNSGCAHEWKDSSSGRFCRECGAWLGELGQEPTPEIYVQHLVEIFHEVWRILRGNGTLWLILGDTYAGSWGAMSRRADSKEARRVYGEQCSNNKITDRPVTTHLSGDLKSKDLVGIPWLVAFALRAAGWYLRADIIWSKPNGLPESVKDRPTRAHEYVFLLSKSRRYYYNHAAIRRPHRESSLARARGKRLSDWNCGYVLKTKSPQTRAPSQSCHPAGANARSIWNIKTEPYPEAHFATFPQKLIEPCILAGSRMGDVVLDPFVGSGTTAIVAKNLGRDFIGIELSQKYMEMAEARIRTETSQLNLFHKISKG